MKTKVIALITIVLSLIIMCACARTALPTPQKEQSILGVFAGKDGTASYEFYDDGTFLYRYEGTDLVMGYKLIEYDGIYWLIEDGEYEAIMYIDYGYDENRIFGDQIVENRFTIFLDGDEITLAQNRTKIAKAFRVD
jgi:hypothetical protein